MFFRRGQVADVTCLPPEHDELQIGDAVELCLPHRRLLLAAGATYGSLLACVAGSVAAVSLVAGVDSDALSAGACVTGFLLGAVLIRLISLRHERMFLPIARRAARQHPVST